jgi:hypothetical protein
MLEIRYDFVALCQLQSQALALVSDIAHLLFQSLGLRVGCMRDRLRHLDAAAPADSIRKDSQGYGQQDTGSERQPNIVPIDLRLPVSVSLREGETSLGNVRYNVFILRVRAQWRDRVQRRSRL